MTAVPSSPGPPRQLHSPQQRVPAPPAALTKRPSFAAQHKFSDCPTKISRQTTLFTRQPRSGSSHYVEQQLAVQSMRLASWRQGASKGMMPSGPLRLGCCGWSWGSELVAHVVH